MSQVSQGFFANTGLLSPHTQQGLPGVHQAAHGASPGLLDTRYPDHQVFVGGSVQMEIMQKMNIELTIEVECLKTEVRTWKEAHATLAQSVEQNSFPTDSAAIKVQGIASFCAALDRAKYGNVKYWEHREYKTAEALEKSTKLNLGTPVRGGTQCANGVNVAQRYIENEHGEVINGARAAALRRMAYSCFEGYFAQGTAPPTWSQASFEVTSHFHSVMEVNFPELCLCSDHWKGNYLCTQIYPSWRKNALEKKKDKTVKTERFDDEIKPSEVVKRSASVDADVFGSDAPASSPAPLKKQRTDLERTSAPKITVVNPLLVHRAQLIPSSPSTTNSSQGSDQLASSQNAGVQGSSVDTGGLVELDSNKDHIIQTPIPSDTSLLSSITNAQVPEKAPFTTFEIESNAVMDGSEDVGTLEIKEHATSMSANDVSPSVPSTSTSAAATLTPSDPVTPTTSGITDDSAMSPVITPTPVPAKKASGFMKPGKSTSARNLCAIDWVKTNKGGSTAEFAAHWNKIEKTLEAEPYHQASAAAKEAKKQAAQS
ncbi:hypothetical protein F5051DRAFT_438021 [Lentinula edodes]|nr:hypothetical protein F5051DRAFT_438021 [Lentinula edodes]